MVGQEALRSSIAAMSSLPSASMLIGERGCGKHLLASEMAERESLPLRDITDAEWPQALDEAMLSPFPAMYLADLARMDERKQNSLLKFAEEPPSGSKVVLLAEWEGAVIPTLANRCVKFRFAPYTADELAGFLPDADRGALKWLTTPGQIKEVDWRLIGPMGELCSSIVGNIGRANLPNALSIADKMNLSGKDFDKFDFRLFVRMLESSLLDAYAAGDSKAGAMLSALSSSAKALADRRVSLRPLAEAAIQSMWEAARR